jgi:hypothetical protein
MKISEFEVHGTTKDSEQLLRLDEITIEANPETLRLLGIFLINSAYEMESNQVEHLHLQDAIDNFSYENHTDVIAINTFSL